MPLATLAAILGHGNLRSIQIHVHPQQLDMQKAMTVFEGAIQARSGLVQSPPGDLAASGTTRAKQGWLQHDRTQKEGWRRGSELNRRMRVLQTLALPLG